MAPFEEVIEASGKYRVILRADDDASEPYDDGASPLLRLDYRHGWSAEHVMKGSRPDDDDARIEEAAERWGAGQQLEKLEKYLRAYYGASQIVVWRGQGDYVYLTYDPAKWREWAGAEPGSANLDEYKAWVEGDTWGVIVQRRVLWTTEDDDFNDKLTWEDVPDLCVWGYYGRTYAEQEAHEALASAVTS